MNNQDGHSETLGPPQPSPVLTGAHNKVSIYEI